MQPHYSQSSHENATPSSGTSPLASVFEGNFQIHAPRGAYIWRGDLMESFLRYEFRGLILGGAVTRRGLLSEFYGTLYVMLCYKG